MSNYLKANHTVQGGHIGSPKTGMGMGSNARFHYAVDRLTVTFDLVGLTVTIASVTESSTSAPSPDEFYTQARNMLQMVTRGLAVMEADGAKLTFKTTMTDANKYQAQREAIAAACGMGNLCENCPLSTRCPDLR